MNSNQAQYLLKCANGLQKQSEIGARTRWQAGMPDAYLPSPFHQLHTSSDWIKKNMGAILGVLGGGLLGTGAGYLLSDEDKKKRGMLAGALTGAGIGGVGGFSADSNRNIAGHTKGYLDGLQNIVGEGNAHMSLTERQQRIADALLSLSRKPDLPGLP